MLELMRWDQVLASGGLPFTPGDAALPARAAATAAEAGDFHWHLARFDRGRDTRCGSAPRHWRWRVRCRPVYLCTQTPNSG